MSKTHALVATGAGVSVGSIHYGETISLSAAGLAASTGAAFMPPLLNARGSMSVVWIMRVR